MLLYYIRHGDPIYDPDSLTPLGLRQAEAVGRRLATHGIDAIYASSSNRAQLTAKPLAEMTGKEIVTLDWANESHAWKEMTTLREDGKRTWCFYEKESVKMMRSPEVLALGKEWYKHPFFAGKNYGQDLARVDREADALLASLGYEHDRENACYRGIAPNEKRIALFAHAGFGMSFLSSILDIPYSIFATRFDLSTSSMTVIRFFEQHPGYFVASALETSNDSHLYAEHLPTRYNNGILI